MRVPGWRNIRTSAWGIGGAWKTSELGRLVRADLALQQSEAVKEAGDLFRRRIKRLTDELAQQVKRLVQIPWEPLRAAI